MLFCHTILDFCVFFLKKPKYDTYFNIVCVDGLAFLFVGTSLMTSFDFY